MIVFSVSSTVFIIIMVVCALAGLSDGVASVKRRLSRKERVNSLFGSSSDVRTKRS
jgi:hypothetical protein